MELKTWKVDTPGEGKRKRWGGRVSLGKKFEERQGERIGKERAVKLGRRPEKGGKDCKNRGKKLTGRGRHIRGGAATAGRTSLAKEVVGGGRKDQGEKSS